MALAQRRPFLLVGMPLTAGLLVVTAALADMRQARYRARPLHAAGRDDAPKRSLKSLEEEFSAWERVERARVSKAEYDMRPVKRQRD